MIEKSLLAILGEPAGYDKYRKLVKKKHVTMQTWEALRAIDHWYETHPTKPVDWGAAYEYYLLTHGGSMNDDNLAIIESLMDSPTTGSLAEDIIRTLQERVYFDKISLMAKDIAEGEGTYDADDVSKTLDDYNTELRASLKAPPVLTAGDILRSAAGGGGMEWGLEELNLSVGNITKGNLILVGARSEVGKTTFLVDQTYGFLSQVSEEHPILYITNEDPGDMIEVRFLQRENKVDANTITKDLSTYQSKWVAAYGKKLLIVDNDGAGCVTWDDLVQYVEYYKPGLLVVDQLRNLRGFEGTGTEVERLGNMFKAARILAKSYCPIIVAHQADASAHGVQYPMPVQLEGTKTEVQGALDVQLMLGRSYEMGEWVRGLHVVKNKCGVGPRTDFKYRHGKFEIILDPIHQHFRGAF